MQRRTFIKNTATVSAFSILRPGIVFGSKANSAIRVGVIGCGNRGTAVISSMSANTNSNIIAIADLFNDKLAAAEKNFNQLNASKNFPALNKQNIYQGSKAYMKLLENKDVDAVLISSPAYSHVDFLEAAVAAGKHVYCEKPLAHSIEEGRAMVNAMKKNNKILQTGSMQRSWKNFRQACELVRNGYIGTIKEVLVNVGDPAIPSNLGAEPVPDYLNWEEWVGPAPLLPYNSVFSPPVEQDIYPNWRLYKEYGGGMVSDWGAHMFDIAQWGLGMDKTGPVKFLPPEGNAMKGLVMIYENGVQVKHEDFGRKYGVRFIGDKGKIDISRDFLDSDPVNIATEIIKPNEIHLYNSADHYLDWLDCIKTGKQPVCDAETGHRTSSVCCLVNIAYWLRKPLNWDPAKEQFTNSSEANQLVKANIRGKWKIS